MNIRLGIDARRGDERDASAYGLSLEGIGEDSMNYPVFKGDFSPISTAILCHPT
jgi:hypothetical protein